MKLSIAFIACFLLAASSVFALQGTTSPYIDAIGDIDPGISTGAGTLDIVGMEVSNTLTDVIFKLTVNGNISTTDWGQFMIGISTGKTPGTTTGNGWDRAINLSSPIGGMDRWVGSNVDGGGGSQLYSYNGTAWVGPASPVSFTLSAGTTSNITYTLSLASLGLSLSDTFYFDAYSSGPSGGDSAIDSLANPNVAVTSWSGPYTSMTTGNGGNGLNSYQVIPEPSTYLLSALGVLAIYFFARRRKA
jgi:hypothetical protein